MHNNTECQGTGVEGRESGEVSANLFPISMLDVGCSLLDVPPIPPAFEETRASQARSDLIQFTKIFFGLDNECPSHTGNLEH
jgi:hypothetical protein